MVPSHLHPEHPLAVLELCHTAQGRQVGLLISLSSPGTKAAQGKHTIFGVKGSAATIDCHYDPTKNYSLKYLCKWRTTGCARGAPRQTRTLLPCLLAVLTDTAGLPCPCQLCLGDTGTCHKGPHCDTLPRPGGAGSGPRFKWRRPNSSAGEMCAPA